MTKIKLLSLIFCPIVIIGTAAIVVSCNKTKHRVFGEEKTSITWDQINSYKKNIMDRLASKVFLYEYNYDTWCDDQASTQAVMDVCGTFNKRFSKFENPQTNKTSTYDDLNSAYNELVSLSKETGVDAVDFYDYENNLIPNLLNQYTIDLKSYNIPNPQTKIDALNKALTQQLTIADNNMYTNTQLAIAIAQQIKVAQTHISASKRSQNSANAELSVALQYAESKLNDTLVVANPNLLLDKLSIYSSTGIYDKGSELSDSDIGDIFTYDYDLTQGSVLSRPTCDYLNATSDTDVFNVNLKMSITRPLTSYTSANSATFGVSEILPGYKLHVKLADIDYNTNSAKCDITLQLGISKSTASGSDILWSSTNSANFSNYKKANGTDEGFVKITLDLDTLAYKQYIADNTYYSGLNSRFYSPAPDSDNVYFSASSSQRPFLDKVLQRYSGDKTLPYDLGNYPIILKEDEIAGLPSPNISSNLNMSGDSIIELNTKYHTNQSLALVATDVNTLATGTHNQSLKIQYAMVENINGKTKIIKTFPWMINGITPVSEMWARYDIDAAFFIKLKYVTAISDVFHGYNSIFSTIEKFSNDDLGKWDNILKIKRDFLIAESTLQVASISLSIVYTACSWMTFGASVAAAVICAATAALSLGVLAFGWVYYAKLEYKMEAAKKAKDESNKFLIAYNTLNVFISSQYSILHDPQGQMTPKNTACDTIINLLNSDDPNNSGKHYIDTIADFTIFVIDLNNDEQNKPHLNTQEKTDILHGFTYNNGATESIVSSYWLGLLSSWASVISSAAIALAKENNTDVGDITDFLEENIEAPFSELVSAFEAVHTIYELCELSEKIKTASQAVKASCIAESPFCPIALIVFSLIDEVVDVVKIFVEYYFS
ncbi:MAG: hypothetical protein Ta2E_06140 [Mycoplasmoidaceae bacterium]|nr:MAG: hypothetical protein Ta2E_06140 [Mycoplasmoidaceae bacterium]